MLCVIGAIVSILCLVLLLTPGSPALIGLYPRYAMGAWIILGFIFYFHSKREWGKMNELDLREQVVGNRHLPVFFKTKR